MKQTAVEFLELMFLRILSFDSEEHRKKYKDVMRQAKEIEKQQQVYSEEEVINALHSVELKYNRDFTKIYEGMLEYLKELKKK